MSLNPVPAQFLAWQVKMPASSAIAFGNTKSFPRRYSFGTGSPPAELQLDRSSLFLPELWTS